MDFGFNKGCDFFKNNINYKFEEYCYKKGEIDCDFDGNHIGIC